MIDKNTPCEFHVVSHTHWDREWRYALQRSKNKLVGCMDKVLDELEQNPDYKHFMCDGQTVMVLDYLDYRPENRDRVVKLAKEGALVLGPWFSLIDEFNSGGEAIVRNLLRGWITANELGGCQKVGYCPASFGHISQMPQILAGFDFDTAMFSRGLTSTETPDLEYIWEGADGTRLLGIHMNEDYTKSNFTLGVYIHAVVGGKDGEPQINEMSGIPFHVCDKETAHWAFFHELEPQYTIRGEVAHEKTLELKEAMTERATVPVICFFDGVDQMEANPMIPDLIKEIDKRLETGDTIIHSSLPQYIEAVKKAVDRGKLKVLSGEMRYPFYRHGGNGCFNNVSSARMYQHRYNAVCENLLEQWAEPLGTIANQLGLSYPVQPMLFAWENLFANHTHDCIGGCAADAVHENVIYRYRQVEETANDILERSLAHLSLQVDLSDVKEDEQVLIVYNPQPFERNEVVTVAIDFPNNSWVEDFTIFDGDKEIPFQTTTRETTYKLLIKWADKATGIPLQRFFVTFQVSDVPSMGYKTYKVRYTKGQQKFGHVYKDKLTRKYDGSIVKTHNTMENEYLRIEFNSNGSFTLTDKENNQTYSDQHFFESSPEVGEIWSPITPGKRLGATTSLSSSARVELLRNGPIEAAYKVDVCMMVPECSDRAAQKPSDKLVPLNISSEVILKKEARRVDIVTKFTNTAKDHLLDAVFPSDLVDAKTATAEGQFDVIERPVFKEHRPDFWEPWFRNDPNQGWVDVSDGKNGLAVINEGITAHQVHPDDRRTITMTLVRATVCPVAITPDEDGAQCLRPHTYRYSIYPHKGNWSKSEIFKQSRSHNIGLRVIETGKHDGELPQTLSFIAVDPDELMISALKPAEDGDGYILRLWNPTDKNVSGKITCFKDLEAACVTDMKEDKIEELSVEGGSSFKVSVDSRKICTIRYKIK